MSSCSGFDKSISERLFFYRGKWRKVGDAIKVRVPFLYWHRDQQYYLSYIGLEGCATAVAPGKHNRTLIGDTRLPMADLKLAWWTRNDL